MCDKTGASFLLELVNVDDKVLFRVACVHCHLVRKRLHRCVYVRGILLHPHHFPRSTVTEPTFLASPWLAQQHMGRHVCAFSHVSGMSLPSLWLQFFAKLGRGGGRGAVPQGVNLVLLLGQFLIHAGQVLTHGAELVLVTACRRPHLVPELL